MLTDGNLEEDNQGEYLDLRERKLIEGCRKAHNEERHNVWSVPNMIKTSESRWI
jgi:hypothetical protein